MNTSINSDAGLPSTHSSQQLMPAATGRESPVNNSPSDRVGGFRSVTRVEWFTVIVLCFVNLINYMDRFTIAGVLTNIQDDFRIGDDEGGLLQTAFILSYMICAPIFGYLGDRYSRRVIMAIGVFIWSLTTLLGSYMPTYGWFLLFRAFVGIGEASYSTIAPTIISDLFAHDLRSKMLALFYFAIPVGSGLGYIVGAETAQIAGSWHWALRVTPVLGGAAVILLFLIREPARGQSDGSAEMKPTSYKEDIIYLLKNRSFMLSTAGFTCVAFVAGALSWWGPKFMHLGVQLQPGNSQTLNSISYKFGLIAMLSGIIGVPLGSYMAQRLRRQTPQWDPLICACGLFVSAPMAYLTMITPHHSTTLSFIFVFFAEVALNLCWSIVADILLVRKKKITDKLKGIQQDGSYGIRVSFTFGALTMFSGIIGVPLGSVLSQMFVKRFPKIDPLVCAAGLFISAPLLAVCMLMISKNSIAAYILLFIGEVAVNLNWAINADILLYVVVPTRRATAEAFQILISHAFGDAGSPYLIGLVSEAIKKSLWQQQTASIASSTIGGIESLALTVQNVTTSLALNVQNTTSPSFGAYAKQYPLIIQFQALQYSLFITNFVEVLGAVIFICVAVYIIKDKDKVVQAVRETEQANSTPPAN